MSENRGLPLETERLILRDFREDDWQSVQEYASDPEVVRYMFWGPNTEQQTKYFIRKVLAGQKEQPRISFDIVLINKADSRLIGAGGLYLRSAENKEGEIGYVLNRRFWNQGFVTEAARKLVAFGFKELGLHRIYATCDPANTGSFRVMEKIGMQREGYLRDHKLMKGTWRDSLLYSILEHELLEHKPDEGTKGGL
jgi:[ribosomal protein S5]-alanine N-acetyltransferase